MGFSQDLKDFVAAFQAGYKMIPSKTDEEYKKARAAYQNALTEKLKWDQSPEMRALDLRERNANIAKAEAYAKYYGEGGRPLRPRVGDLEDLTPEEEAAVPDDFDPFTFTDPETNAFARGGAVPVNRTPKKKKPLKINQAIPAYAGGGLADEPEEEDNPVEEKAEVTQPSNPGPGFSFMAVDDAIKAGEQGIDEHFGLTGAVPGPKTARGAQAKEVGIGAVDPKQLQEIDAAMGIQDMPEGQRNLVRIQGPWEFYMRHGMPNRAKVAAGRLLQTYKMIKNRYQAIAKQCAAEGDVEGAVDAAIRTNDWIPDGKSITCKKTKDGHWDYKYVDDRTGKTIYRRLMTPDEVLQEITNYGLNNEEDLVYATGNKDEIARVANEKKAKQSRERTQEYVKARQTQTPEKLREFLNSAAGTDADPYQPLSQEELELIPAGKYYRGNGRLFKKKAPTAAAPE